MATPTGVASTAKYYDAVMRGRCFSPVTLRLSSIPSSAARPRIDHLNRITSGVNMVLYCARRADVDAVAQASLAYRDALDDRRSRHHAHDPAVCKMPHWVLLPRPAVTLGGIPMPPPVACRWRRPCRDRSVTPPYIRDDIDGGIILPGTVISLKQSTAISSMNSIPGEEVPIL